MTRRDLPVMAFKSQEAWNAWLGSQPARSKGLWLKLAKKSSGIASVSRQEAVDTALCHGWIDGPGRVEKFVSMLLEGKTIYPQKSRR
jgi:uncharacterized protein YdeI (YjbR/CyaY-like superfamily)